MARKDRENICSEPQTTPKPELLQFNKEKFGLSQRNFSAQLARVVAISETGSGEVVPRVLFREVLI